MTDQTPTPEPRPQADRNRHAEPMDQTAVDLLAGVQSVGHRLRLGAFLRSPLSFDGPPSGAVGVGLPLMPRSLPDPHGKAFWKALRAERRTLRGIRRDLMSVRREIAATIVLEPYDRSAVQDAFQQFDTVFTQVEEVSVRLLLDRLDDMTAAERASFAENLQKPARRRKKERETRP